MVAGADRVMKDPINDPSLQSNLLTQPPDSYRAMKPSISVKSRGSPIRSILNAVPINKA